MKKKENQPSYSEAVYKTIMTTNDVKTAIKLVNLSFNFLC